MDETTQMVDVALSSTIAEFATVEPAVKLRLLMLGVEVPHGNTVRKPPAWEFTVVTVTMAASASDGGDS